MSSLNTYRHLISKQLVIIRHSVSHTQHYIPAKKLSPHTIFSLLAFSKCMKNIISCARIKNYINFTQHSLIKYICICILYVMYLNLIFSSEIVDKCVRKISAWKEVSAHLLNICCIFLHNAFECFCMFPRVDFTEI